MCIRDRFTIVEIGQDKNRIYAEWSRS
jgi:hypothetical protein